MSLISFCRPLFLFLGLGLVLGSIVLHNSVLLDLRLLFTLRRSGSAISHLLGCDVRTDHAPISTDNAPISTDHVPIYHKGVLDSSMRHRSHLDVIILFRSVRLVQDHRAVAWSYIAASAGVFTPSDVTARLRVFDVRVIEIFVDVAAAVDCLVVIREYRLVPDLDIICVGISSVPDDPAVLFRCNLSDFLSAQLFLGPQVHLDYFRGRGFELKTAENSFAAQLIAASSTFSAEPAAGDQFYEPAYDQKDGKHFAQV